MRRAFTLVEAALAVAIGSLILAVLSQVFATGHHESVDAERRLQSVAALQRISQALEADLALLAPVGDESRIQVTDKGAGLKFRVARVDLRAPPGEGMILFCPLGYRLDRQTHRVMRSVTGPKEGTTVRALPGVNLLDLHFSLTPRLDPGAAPPAIAPDCLLVQVVWAPAEDLEAGRTPLAKDIVSTSLSFGLEHLSDDARFPGWVTNPTSRAVVVEE